MAGPSTPVTYSRPEVQIWLGLGELSNRDIGVYFRRFEFRGLMNGGYIVRATLSDPHFNILASLVKERYFSISRRKPIPVYFIIKSGPDGQFPKGSTRQQTAILTSLEAAGDSPDKGELTFVAIDPPSWYLNVGDASGGVWNGRVEQVIRQVCQRYAPDISVTVGRTIDSEQNKWWQMRLDPKAFILSLLDWSSAITLRRTQWVLESDGFNLSIQEQGMMQSRQRAFYRYMDEVNHDTIKGWQFLANNALSTAETKLITQGLSAISGHYLDKITDQQEKSVVVKDKTTSSKQIAKVNKEFGFEKPPEAGPTTGSTAIAATPEIYSAGDLGLRYDKYIDGRPRAIWLGLVNALMRARFQVVGHGEWSDCRGLGVDTIFVRWTQALGLDDTKYWWMSGNWLVYGFYHVVERRSWYTYLDCARADIDADAVKVGAGDL